MEGAGGKQMNGVKGEETTQAEAVRALRKITGLNGVCKSSGDSPSYIRRMGVWKKKDARLCASFIVL